MKILLISANPMTTPYPVYPLGLDHVAGTLRPHHTVRILDWNTTAAMDDLESAIRTFMPDMVGISLRNVDTTDITRPETFMAAYCDLMSAVRRAVAAPVVLGGSGFTIFPAEAMAGLNADYGIVGEGERLTLLLDALSNGQDPSAIEGVVTGCGPVTRPGPWMGAITPHFDPHQSHVEFYTTHGGILNLQSKRGCPFGCIYCTYPHIEGRRMRLFSPDAIARMAMDLQAGGARYLFMTDSAFNADTDHSLAVAKAFKKAGLSIPWGAFFAPTSFPPDYFEIMRECGLLHVEFGTESMSDPVLSAYGKPFHHQQVFTAHRMAKDAGLHTSHYFLFGGPGETRETLSRSLDRIEALDQCAVFMFCGMRIYPFTKLYDLALAEEQIRKDQDLTLPIFYRPLGMDPQEIPEIITKQANGRINWIIGAGSPENTRITTRMYEKGYTGPLWEYLCR
ncbi:radical SAM protein [Desulfosarcina sp. OttesenSCG-928-A07]|nr:radical SAM protein [Desulfosarcina sp. OttesenSCG-928-G17]MDL2328578.1 radical SAM protein [Desulfosarcina sp. OttesenSCG-928-A07]